MGEFEAVVRRLRMFDEAISRLKARDMNLTISRTVKMERNNEFVTILQ